MAKKTDDARRNLADERAKPRITGAQVAEYLREHRDFLVRHPELLDLQIAPGRRRGEGVVDLQQYMVDQLRRELTRLKADQDDLLANSRDNLSTQERIHQAALALLEAESLAQFAEIISTDLAIMLDVDAVALCLEAPYDQARGSIEGVQSLAAGTVDRLLGPDCAVLLRDDTVGDPAIFDSGAGLVRSDALIRLGSGDGGPLGLIAFGTRHPGYFDSGQGTELLSFLASIVVHCLRKWIPQPDARA
jgi:hypothetical protein